MKLWDVLATCLLLVSSVSTRPLFHKLQPARRALRLEETESPAQDPVIDSYSEADSLRKTPMDDLYDITGPYPEQLEDVMDFIEATLGRLRRSSDLDGGSVSRKDRAKQKGAANAERGGKGRGDRRRGKGRSGGRGGRGGRDDRVKTQGRGCLLKEVHLNVTDLGLGYRTKEELIFRYCSGPCVDAETNYDKILNNLTHNKKLDKDTPSRTCCRPIAFDNDLSFLDDNLEYHILKKHSARKCACV